MSKDNIKITILEDGTIKTETDGISSASHTNAENFLKEIFRLSGGKQTVEFKNRLGVHEHAHGEHVHAH